MQCRSFTEPFHRGSRHSTPQEPAFLLRVEAKLRLAALQLAAFVLICVASVSCSQAPLQAPRDPQRIISLKPNLTEILFALDAGARVVGVTTHCLWPEAATRLPKVGGYAFPDLERILALKPDLIVTNKESGNPRFIALLQEARIPVLVLETRTIGDIYTTIETLGTLLKKSNQAHTLVGDIKKRFAVIHSQQHKPAPRTLVVIQRHPLMVVGTHSFISEILTQTGIHNVVPEGRSAYPTISIEEVIAWQPEVIIDIDPNSTPETWQDYQSVPAVRNRQVFSLSPNIFRPGPRIALAAEMIANALRTPKP